MHTPTVDSPPHRPSTTRTARFAAAFAAPSVLLLVLVALSWGPLMSLDESIANTTHGWAVDERGVTHAFRILTDWVWDPVTMRLLAAAAAVWLVWRHREWWLALWLAVTCAVGTAMQQALKAAVGRERPAWPDPVDSAHYAAYPSGHAMTATVVLGLLVWLLHRYGSRPGPHTDGPGGGRRLRRGCRRDPDLAGRALGVGRRGRIGSWAV